VTGVQTCALPIFLVPFHHPLRLAEDAAVVDQLSGGRLILGLGLGWREEEFRMFDIPYRKRVLRTVETVEILRRAWSQERFSYEGKIFRFDRVKITPPPAKEGGPPIYIGGHVEAAVRRAGRMGDGYIRSRSGVDAAKESLRLAEEAARESGKDPGSLGFALLQNAFVWEEGDAWEVVRPGVEHQLGVYPGWASGSDTPGRPLEVPPPPDEVLRATTPAGDRHEVLRALRPLVDTFAGREEFHLVVRLHYPGMDFDTAARAVELFGTEVLPALKGT
jgi:alkanesulfonate monooxygenase SsuD/methylene tetrahydromethanopterin reductase-like flavin-dependent oxidoreductase (luciferase family)